MVVLILQVGRRRGHGLEIRTVERNMIFACCGDEIFDAMIALVVGHSMTLAMKVPYEKVNCTACGISSQRLWISRYLYKRIIGGIFDGGVQQGAPLLHTRLSPQECDGFGHVIRRHVFDPYVDPNVRFRGVVFDGCEELSVEKWCYSSLKS